MRAISALAALACIMTLAFLGLGPAVRAGGDKVAYPENYAKGTLYGSVDRADLKQYREFFTSAAAIDAVKKGQPIPNGTVITMVNYKAQVDAQGNPLKDASGRFMKGDVAGYAVMEKRAGWGAEYPPELRNGEWEYQAFTPAKAVNDKANLKACFECHKPLDKQDFVFSFNTMKAAK